ncbi:MAG TPA: YCF48-related protein [Steroidobacteraceae bacterium]|nr:YCF48-related protein [Steroidobacteraceae bacterium]
MKPLVICIVAAGLMAGVSVVRSADEATAPNVEYAEMAPLAPRSLLLDAAMAGARMVIVGERGHVLLSDDQGKQWRQSRVPTRATLTGVFFLNAQLGWAVGHDEVILRSEDGGETWTRTHFAPQKQQPLLDVWFADADNGFAFGAYGTILASHDGGRTWAEQIFEPKEREDKQASGLRPQASGKGQEKEASGVGPQAEEQASGLGPQDSGEERAKKNEDEYDVEESASDAHLNAVSQAADGKLYLAAEAGHLFRSDDGGASWLELPSPYEGSFFGVLPLDAQSLLAYGLRGHLYRSDDAGLSWHQLSVDSRAMLTNALRLDANTIVVTGLAGTLLLSRDGGQSFQLLAQEDRKGIAAALAAGNNLVTAGEAGIKTIVLPGAAP